jgi:predicted cupin superfamily sugar epimerase
MTAAEVKETLGLVPHPREGGWFVQTWAATERIEGRGRVTGTAIYYLLEPGTFSEMHRLASDEVFHLYAGDAVEQVQLFADGTGRRVVLGMDLQAGERPQVVVERGVWQGARLVEGGEWALMGCTVSPGFEYEDYEDGGAEDLVQGWPEFEGMIRDLTRRG